MLSSAEWIALTSADLSQIDLRVADVTTTCKLVSRMKISDVLSINFIAAKCGRRARSLAFEAYHLKLCIWSLASEAWRLKFGQSHPATKWTHRCIRLKIRILIVFQLVLIFGLDPLARYAYYALLSMGDWIPNPHYWIVIAGQFWWRFRKNFFWAFCKVPYDSVNLQSDLTIHRLQSTTTDLAHTQHRFHSGNILRIHFQFTSNLIAERSPILFVIN